MPIQRVKQFLETSDLGIVHSLGIESNQLAECEVEINRRGIEGVFGCPVFGFEEASLDFLERLNPIRQVWFWEVKLSDIDGLYAQPKVEYFDVSPKRPPIDFSLLPRLNDAVWHPVKKDSGIETLETLWNLSIWRYKPKEKSLNGLELPSSIRKLEFNWCNLDRLDGLMSLPNLEELQLHYCRNLRSLGCISSIAPNLKKLVVTRCANLEDFAEVEEMELSHVYINVRGKEMLRHGR